GGVRHERREGGGGEEVWQEGEPVRRVEELEAGIRRERLAGGVAGVPEGEAVADDVAKDDALRHVHPADVAVEENPFRGEEIGEGERDEEEDGGEPDELRLASHGRSIRNRARSAASAR